MKGGSKGKVTMEGEGGRWGRARGSAIGGMKKGAGRGDEEGGVSGMGGGGVEGRRG